ncbi:MAG: hypothetical protein COA68_12175 [Oceanobacter sp.]|nr:MAG: hypothetical protein COA68_12175 [Oceanobacter sp.]
MQCDEERAPLFSKRLRAAGCSQPITASEQRQRQSDDVSCEPLHVKRRLEHDMASVQVCDGTPNSVGAQRCQANEEEDVASGCYDGGWPMASSGGGRCRVLHEGPVHTVVMVNDVNRGLRRETSVRFHWSDERHTSGFVEAMPLLASVLSLVEGPDWRHNAPHANVRVILRGKDLLRSPASGNRYFVSDPSEALHVYYCKTS